MTEASEATTPGGVQSVYVQQDFALERLAPLEKSETQVPAAIPDLVQARSDIEAAAI
jgi:hypothetical protein